MCNGITLNNSQYCPYEIRSGADAGDCFRGKKHCPGDFTLEQLEEMDNKMSEYKMDVAEYKFENKL